MMKILHITPHMGGGVGNLISKIMIESESIFESRVVIQEAPQNTYFLDLIKDKFKIIKYPTDDEIKDEIEWCDIVIVHWWHHPKTSEFMYNFPYVKTKVIFWSHISNLTAPILNASIIKAVNKTLFTTEASYDAEEYHFIDRSIMLKKTEVVYGCGGLEKFEYIDRSKDNGFNIGYLGFVDFSKMNPNYIEFCNEVNIPECKFILAGDGSAIDIIKKQKENKNIKNEFIFLGYVKDVKSVLSKFHVFGYPLANYHTCTTENVLIEAMASEVVPVVINQLSEKYIVEDGKTGFLVSNEKEYGEVIRYLHDNPSIRMQIGKNAREYVMEKFTSEKTLKKLYKICQEVVEEPSKIFDFKQIIGNTPAEWFLSGVGNNLKYFIDNDKYDIFECSELLRLENKGSVFHYARLFNDKRLISWANTIRRGKFHE